MFYYNILKIPKKSGFYDWDSFVMKSWWRLKYFNRSRNNRLNDICVKRHLREVTFARSRPESEREKKRERKIERERERVGFQGKWLYWQPILT